MPVTDTDLKNLIITQVGGDTETGTLAASIDLIWTLAQGQSGGVPQLQFLLAKREAIDTLIGYYRSKVDYRIGSQQRMSHQQVNNLINLRNFVQANINDVRKGTARGGAQGQLTRTFPIVPADDDRTASMPDPNDRSYGGDPLLPPRWTVN